MRGKVEQREQMQISIRITPAYAGKRRYYRNVIHVCEDHPRLCGEKWIRSRQLLQSAGSPPPMRGKASFPHGLALASRDHPRLCGEKLHITERFRNNQGSPPPMRGKEAEKGGLILRFRITPAYAGKSRPHITSGEPSWDHPRLCGEKVTVVVPLIPYSGSPPPMRGKVYRSVLI